MGPYRTANIFEISRENMEGKSCQIEFARTPSSVEGGLIKASNPPFWGMIRDRLALLAHAPEHRATGLLYGKVIEGVQKRSFRQSDSRRGWGRIEAIPNLRRMRHRSTASHVENLEMLLRQLPWQGEEPLFDGIFWQHVKRLAVPLLQATNETGTAGPRSLRG